MTHRLERASPAHAAALSAIHGTAFLPAETWSAAIFAQHLGQPSVLGLISAAGGLVLARRAADEAEILTIAVCPAARRQGLGGALLDTARAELERSGARAVFLEVGFANDAARRLYAAAGFIEVGRRKHYYADGDDACIMRLDLSVRPAR